MTLEIGSGNKLLDFLKARWLQCTVVAVLALTWWRGELWVEDARRADEASVQASMLESARAAAEAALLPATVDVIVGANDTLERIFRKLSLSVTDLATLRSLPDLRASLDKLYPGELLKFRVQDSKLVGLERQLSPSETLKVSRDPNGFASELIINPLEREVVTGEATIRYSLFQAASDAGMSDGLALRIADVFRWDIDFVLDIQPGDRFRVTYEQISQDGEPIGDGDVLAVEFINQAQVYRAVRFSPDGQNASYYTPDGKSLRKAFLRAPLEFTRVSSRFNPYRRHPVLNRIRAHRGTDYAAPIGTPVKAAGAGRVRFIGNKGGYGKVIELEHANEIRTVYGHLSRFARGLRVGQRVSQGDVIGHVGMTGLATGPHLHYEYLARGVHKDPQKVPLPNDQPIPASRMAAFRDHAAPLIATLDQGSPAPYLARQAQNAASGGTTSGAAGR